MHAKLEEGVEIMDRATYINSVASRCKDGYELYDKS